jgi:ornithine cyclodeaminase/alanine dehydrogenase-like protein (mu-crystallin family)
MTLILSNDDVTAVLTMPECIEVLEDAYRELAAGRGATRTRSDVFAATSREDALYSLKSMDGVAPKSGVGAVRINSDVVTWPTRDGNARREKVPSAPGGRWVGLVLLFSSETGEPLAIFPDGVLQRMRVGATNGLGAKYLARSDARTVGLLGSGWQAGSQVMAITAVRPIERIRCYSPNREHREAFANEVGEQVGVEIIPVDSPEAAVRGADVVLCATNTIDTVFFERWIEPGQHISSIKKPEIEPAAIARSDRVVVHTHDTRPMQVLTEGVVLPENAEGKGWSLAGEVDFDALPELKDLIAGTVPGRVSPEQVTCFLNNLGLGYQFAATGALVYRKAREQSRGQELPTDWFTEDVHP